jgi:hypothetical protein
LSSFLKANFEVLNETKRNIWQLVQDNLAYGFNTYKDFLFGLIIGMFVGWIYHRFIGTYTLKQSYKQLLNAKDETLTAYKALISERLEKIEVAEQGKTFFKNLKKFFRRSNS